MEIAGNRVVIRSVEEQDQEMIRNLVADPEIVKVTGGYPPLTSCGHHVEWFRAMSGSAGNLYKIIADKENPRTALGIIILSHERSETGAAELFIKLMRSVRGKGYGEDAVNTLVSYAFREQGIRHIYSNILEDNMASRRLFEKCRFRQEDIHKSNLYKNGSYRKVCRYVINSEESKTLLQATGHQACSAAKQWGIWSILRFGQY